MKRCTAGPKPVESAVLIRNNSAPDAVDATEALVQAARYSGWGLAEYRRHQASGDLFFMEVNAKFWASIEFTFRNDPQFSELLFGVRTEVDAPESMVFWDRALRRGARFVLRYSHQLSRARVARDSAALPNPREAMGRSR